jgi:hypothetical protein
MAAEALAAEAGISHQQGSSARCSSARWRFASSPARPGSPRSPCAWRCETSAAIKPVRCGTGGHHTCPRYRRDRHRHRGGGGETGSRRGAQPSNRQIRVYTGATPEPEDSFEAMRGRAGRSLGMMSRPADPADSVWTSCLYGPGESNGHAELRGRRRYRSTAARVRMASTAANVTAVVSTRDWSENAGAARPRTTSRNCSTSSVCPLPPL